MPRAPRTGAAAMKIAELERVSGTRRSTIHYYRTLGLLPPPARRGPKLHLYGAKHVRRLREVAALRADGASIEALQRRFARRGRDATGGEEIAPPRRRRAGRAAADADLRETILIAAAREFVAHGYEAVRVDDVVRATGISKTTFYACFPSKADLFVDCLDRLRLAVIGPERRAALGPPMSFTEETRARAAAVLERAGPYRMMTNLLAQAAESGDPELARRARAARHRMVTGARPMFERAIARGECRPLDPELLAYLTWGALLSIADRLALDDRYTPDDALAALLDFARLGTAPRP